MSAYQTLRSGLQTQDLAFLKLPQLTDDEIKADAKLKLLRKAFLAEFSEDELKRFWEVKDKIIDTQLFQVLRAMPKGATLHAHCGATTEPRWNFETFVKSDLAYYHPAKGFKVPKHNDDMEGWTPVTQYLQEHPEAEEALYADLTLTSEDCKAPSQVIWSKFQRIFDKTFYLLNYSDFAKAYLWRTLEIFYQDNVTRLELRIMPNLSFTKERNCTLTEELETINGVVQEFVAAHPGFSVGFIYSGGKWSNPEEIKRQALQVYEGMKLFPGLILGYDLVGEEETLSPNAVYAEVLQEVADFARSEGHEFLYFFHGKD